MVFIKKPNKKSKTFNSVKRQRLENQTKLDKARVRYPKIRKLLLRLINTSEYNLQR